MPIYNPWCPTVAPTAAQTS